MANRERRTAASITVDFGQHDAGERQRFVKRFSGIGRILTGHGIDHKQRFNRLNRGMNLLDLVHHRFIDVQTAGGIHQQHIVEFQFGFFERGVNNIDRFLRRV